MNLCLITAGIVPEVHYYNVLPYVGSYIPSPIASGCLFQMASGGATEPSYVYFAVTDLARLAYLGAHFLAVYKALCQPMLSVTYCEHVNVYLVCVRPVPLMLLCL